MRITVTRLATAMVVLLLAVTPHATAQEARKIPRIGVLMGALTEGSPGIEALRQALRELGYVEGQNVAIEWRWARGDVARLPDLAQELVRLKVDLIVANSNAPIGAAQRATREIPIVMVYPSDPVALGFVASLARPEGNLTGLTVQTPELESKRLQLLKEALPRLSRVAGLWDPAFPGARQRITDAEVTAAALGLRLQFVEAGSPNDFDSAFAAMIRMSVAAVLHMGSTMHFAHRARIAELAARHRLPMICSWRDYAEAGCLMSYSADYTALFRRAAYFVDKILKGAKPRDLPVEQPTKFELVINMKTARAVGLRIPSSLLLRADHVIE